MIVVGGAFLRPQSKPIAAVQTNELATLQDRSRERSLREIADYVGERAALLAASVVYLPGAGASGVVVGPDSVFGVAASPHTPEFLLVHPVAGDTVQPAAHAANVTTLSPRWALVIARAPDGHPLWLAGMTGSVVPVRCGELAIRELAFGAPVPEAFAGGGLFDLDGNLLALATPCAGHIALVPMSDIAAALERQATPEFRLWARYGFRVAPAASIQPALPGGASGLVVVETLVGGPADRVGLWPGDQIAATQNGPVTGLPDLESLADASRTGRLEVRRRRGSVVLTLVHDSVGRGRAEVVAGRPAGALVLRHVGAGSRAERAGLRAGDTILQIGRSRRPSAAAVDRALTAGGALFLVYEREGHRHGVVLR